MTAMPLHDDVQKTVVGVVEVVTDIQTLVTRNERAQLLIASTAALLMGVMYFSLMAVIRRMHRLVDLQQQALQERSDLLAALSSDILNIEEHQKEQIARTLHEHVAQSLAAIKFDIERTCLSVRKKDEITANLLKSLLNPIRNAIEEIRLTATDLRPSCLDDMGLLPAIQWLIGRSEESRPELRIAANIDVTETDLPRPLVAVIFRVLEDMLNIIKSDTFVNRVQIRLVCENPVLKLSVLTHVDLADKSIRYFPPLFVRARERIISTGGEYEVMLNPEGNGANVLIRWVKSMHQVDSAAEASPGLVSGTGK